MGASRARQRIHEDFSFCDAAEPVSDKVHTLAQRPFYFTCASRAFINPFSVKFLLSPLASWTSSKKEKRADPLARTDNPPFHPRDQTSWKRDREME